jgi:hypothetical protein
VPRPQRAAALFGDERRIGERLAAAGDAIGLPARIGIGATRTLARRGAGRAGILVVPPGAEQEFAPAPSGSSSPSRISGARSSAGGSRRSAPLAP